MINPVNPKPSLNSAYLRVKRASEHLEQAKLLHDAVIAAQRKATVIKSWPNVAVETGEAKEIISIKSGQTAIPDDLRILIGEIAHNLRTALDYLVAQLSLLDTPNTSGKKRRTQFPIESTKEQFRGKRKSFLEGVSDKHVALIEDLQGYNGCDWIDPLRGLSNFDKHDDLVITAHDYILNFEGTIAPTESSTKELQMKVNLQPVLRATLADGLPVIETLEILKLRVSETLDVFNPSF